MDFMNLMETVNKMNINLNISTITMIAELSICAIDLKAFYNYISKQSNIIVKYSDNNKDFVVTKRGKKKRNFFNQVTINYSDITKKSIKVFLNGKIQITGIIAMYEFEMIMKRLCKWISNVSKEQVDIKSYKIAMINSNFNIKWYIDLSKLNKIFEETINVLSRYEPDTYPAINLKYMENEVNVSMFIFNSGNVVITGAKSINEVKSAYIFIISILNRHKDAIYVKENEIIKDNKDIIVHGYKLKQLISTIK